MGPHKTACYLKTHVQSKYNCVVILIRPTPATLFIIKCVKPNTYLWRKYNEKKK